MQISSAKLKNQARPDTTCVFVAYICVFSVQVFTGYFKELEEESIQDNFVVVYELLDELMDFGFPQTTDSKILQEYVLITLSVSINTPH